jgi:hypothetical protein
LFELPNRLFPYAINDSEPVKANIMKKIVVGGPNSETDTNAHSNPNRVPNKHHANHISVSDLFVLKISKIIFNDAAITAIKGISPVRP